MSCTFYRHECFLKLHVLFPFSTMYLKHCISRSPGQLFQCSIWVQEALLPVQCLKSCSGVMSAGCLAARPVRKDLVPKSKMLPGLPASKIEDPATSKECKM